MSWFKILQNKGGPSRIKASHWKNRPYLLPLKIAQIGYFFSNYIQKPNFWAILYISTVFINTKYNFIKNIFLRISKNIWVIKRDHLHLFQYTRDIYKDGIKWSLLIIWTPKYNWIFFRFSTFAPYLPLLTHHKVKWAFSFLKGPFRTQISLEMRKKKLWNYIQYL